MKYSQRHIIHSLPMLRYAVMLAIGIVAGDAVSEWVDTKWLSGAILAAAAVALLLNRQHGMACSILILGCISGVGMWRAVYSNQSAQLHMPTHSRQSSGIADGRSGRPTRVHATLCALGEAKRHGDVVAFDAIVCHADSGHTPLLSSIKGRKLRVATWQHTIGSRTDSICAGHGIRVTMTIRRNKNTENGTHFNYERWLRSRGFAANAWITSYDKQPVSSIAQLSLSQQAMIHALSIRKEAVKCLEHAGITGESLALVRAMTLGDKTGLKKEMRDEYSDAGAAHILALSGMHLSIVFSFLMLLCRRRRWWTSVIIITFVWCYVLLAGVPLSMVRAACMLSIWEVMSMMQQEQNPLNVFGCAMAVMLLASPESLWDVGFQMSYMAVLGIFLFARNMNALLPLSVQERWYGASNAAFLTKMQRYAWGLCAVSISAQTATAPLAAYYFGRLPLYFLITNLVAVPAATIIIPLSLTTIALSAIGTYVCQYLMPAATLCGKAVSLMAYAQNEIAGGISSLPAASIQTDINLVQTWALYAILLVAAICIGRWRNKSVY